MTIGNLTKIRSTFGPKPRGSPPPPPIYNTLVGHEQDKRILTTRSIYKQNQNDKGNQSKKEKNNLDQLSGLKKCNLNVDISVRRLFLI